MRTFLKSSFYFCKEEGKCMNETEIDTLERLTEVKKAISTILEGGQEYQIGNQKFRRADLKVLLEIEKQLTDRYLNTKYTHRAFVGWGK